MQGVVSGCVHTTGQWVTHWHIHCTPHATTQNIPFQRLHSLSSTPHISSRATPSVQQNAELTTTLELSSTGWTQSEITDTCSTTLCRQSLCTTTTLPVNHFELCSALPVPATNQMETFVIFLTNIVDIKMHPHSHPPLPDGWCLRGFFVKSM